MIIKRRFLVKHKTKGGGWTKNQMEIVGETWPITKGWQDRVIGIVISQDAARRFRLARTCRQMKEIK